MNSLSHKRAMKHNAQHNGVSSRLETKDLNNDKVSLSSTGGAMVIAGTLPVPTLDVDGRRGWLYQKVLADSGKFNYYIYGNTGSSYQYTLGDLKTVHFVGSIDNWTDGASAPFIVIYSKPTGVGDAEVWYHSRRRYALDTSQRIVVGEQVNWYFGDKPDMNNNNRYIKLSTYLIDGDNLDSEEILYITIHSDSSALNTKILLSSVGYNLKNEIYRNIELV